MNEYGAPLSDLVERDSSVFADFLRNAGKTMEQFELEVVGRVLAFCEIHAERISACLLHMPIDRVQLIVGTPEAFDFELGDCETLLELEIFGDGWETFDVHQLPANPTNEALVQFSLFAAHSAEEEM
ncbi:MAG: hypothetical protein G01um101425_462 [Candidatus Peregrinibacteria bacterium Gr01-1014_25]|nr:MAG: hypothetical protein G01um101425_462 [Candidatus Peregrinibacteria bacterium Gr01-1014_25]